MDHPYPVFNEVDIRPPQASDTDSIPQFAKEYNANKYKNEFVNAADIVGLSINTETDNLEALLIERALEPFAGLLAWPGGLVQRTSDDDAKAAALRELREETSVSDFSYIETLDTYDSNGRDPRQFAGRISNGKWENRGRRVTSKAFLTLFPDNKQNLAAQAGEDAIHPQWRNVYTFLPWEDLRDGTKLIQWIKKELKSALPTKKIETAFGLDRWNEELTRERFALLFQANLIEEATRNHWGQGDPHGKMVGKALAFDHRLMMADALSRLRGKIKYQPEVLKALMPKNFTLGELQNTCEAISGLQFNRSNFRKLVSMNQSTRITKATGKTRQGEKGVPPRLYQFNPSAIEKKRLRTALRFPIIKPT
jgi:hypothetical protein